MRLFTVITAMLLVGCTDGRPPAPKMSVADRPVGAHVDSSIAPAAGGEGCRGLPSAIAGTGVESVLEGVARARANDQRCGSPPDDVRICRTLFVLATVDPALHLTNPVMLAGTVDAIQWVAADAFGLAEPALAAALDAQATAAIVLGSSTDEGELRDALFRRAQPEFLVPLDSFWAEVCAAG